MIQLVIDASVAAKWMQPGQAEPLREEANIVLRRLHRQEVEGVVPDVFWSEIVHLLWKAVRRRRIEPTGAMEALDQLRELDLRSVATADVAESALKLALDFNHSGYDMMYVALTLNLKAEMVTADEVLVRKVGWRLPVRWLGAI